MAFLVIYAAGMENDFLSFCRRQDVRALVGGVKPWGGQAKQAEWPLTLGFLASLSW